MLRICRKRGAIGDRRSSASRLRSCGSSLRRIPTACPAGASGTVAAGGRQSGYGSRAGVAKNQLNKRLAFCFFPWHAADMPETWRYRGQEIVSEQIAFLREFIEAHPDSSRWKLSRQLCEALGWKQPNGALRDVVCRGLLLMLERAGQIQLPPVRCHIRGQSRRERSRPPAFRIDTTPLAMPLKSLGPIDIQLVRRTADEPLFHSLMEEHHYLDRKSTRLNSSHLVISY